MLDLNITDMNNEKQTSSTQVRHGASLAALIERAVTAVGAKKSDFLRNAIAKEAQRIIANSTHHVLTTEDAKLFAATLDKPLIPTSRALKAARSYKQRIKSAD